MSDAHHPSPRRKRERCCLAVSDWPQAHRVLWDTALKRGSRLRPGGPAAGWADSTRATAERAYAEWLYWLRDHEPDWATLPPAELLTEQSVLAFIEELERHVEPVSVAMKIDKLRQIVKAMMPTEAWDWLSVIARNLISAGGKGRDKRERIIHLRLLFEFGLRLMVEADERPSLSPRRRAVLFRDGLMIALLAARPLRKRDLRNMVLGTTLVRELDHYRLRYQRTSKTKQPLDIHCPAPLTAPFDRYFAVYRPILAGAGPQTDARPTAVWISGQGRPMGDSTVYAAITSRTLREFGKSINPHLFRDCVATTIAIDDPAYIQIAMVILGHTTFAMVNDRYNQACSVDALRALDGVVADAAAGREPARRERPVIPTFPKVRGFGSRAPRRRAA